MRDARVAAGWTQEQLADRLGVTLRTVGNWERANPPAASQARLRAVLRDHLDEAGEPPLRSVSDAELLAEIARRFTRSARPQEVEHGPQSAPMTERHPGEVTAPADTDVDVADELAHRRRAGIADDIAAGRRPAAARTDEQGE